MREPSTEITRAVLEDLGFVVEDIPEAQPQKRADLRATSNGDEYVVEAKGKGPTTGGRSCFETPMVTEHSFVGLAVLKLPKS